MSLHEIRDEKRVAHAAIRGFLAQVLLAAERWVGLPSTHVLVVEGNEDLDQNVFENGILVEAREESVKDLAKAVSVRSQAVHETIANFVQAFQHHHSAGTPCRLVFTQGWRI